MAEPGIKALIIATDVGATYLSISDTGALLRSEAGATTALDTAQIT